MAKCNQLTSLPFKGLSCIRVCDVDCAQFPGEFSGGRSWGRAEGLSSRWGEGAGTPRPGHDAHSNHLSTSSQGAPSSSASADGRRSIGQQNTRDGSCRCRAAWVNLVLYFVV